MARGTRLNSDEAIEPADLIVEKRVERCHGQAERSLQHGRSSARVDFVGACDLNRQQTPLPEATGEKGITVVPERPHWLRRTSGALAARALSCSCASRGKSLRWSSA